MRASVMLWLPGLALTDGLKPVLRAMSVMNLTVRGLFGEGTEALGFVLQFSNQSTLGESESQILQRLERVVRQLVWSEENARLRLASHSPARLLDLVGRAYGTLFYAHELAAEEALNCLFAVRLGVVTDLFSNLDLATVDELILRTQPGHLQAEHGQTLTEKRAGRLRADRVRKALKDHRPGGR